ncbi:hypothetical protein [Trueperella pecoris]|uniref:hypothetical protein n=1 Tax=Trueperella pecoris TaxID=2733571 RepID=UPI001ABDFAC8|nr:hypothetical protein [Trueperella pecoris]QTG75099.1 hypothetical protein J4179_07700 [Trueperella pecoris]
MMSYVLGAFVLAVFTTLFYGFGAALRKDAGGFAANLVVGYIGHSLLVALLVVPLQLLQAPFLAVVGSVSAVMAVTVAFTVVRWQREGLWDSGPGIKRLVGESYFLFLIAFSLMVIYLLQTDLIWNNNHTDDGFYLVKSATLPYLDQPFSTIYGTGFLDTSAAFNTYHLSSIQAEMSVYIYALNIDPVFFMRGVLNFFHYLLAAASVAWFAETLATGAFLNLQRSWAQYTSAILLLLSFEFRSMDAWRLLSAQDLWQFNGAMWYGGSIVRVMGILWMITPFLNAKRIGVREIAQAMVIGVVLISKAVAAAPIIVIAGLSYLFAFIATSIRRRYIATIGLAVGVVIAGYAVNNQPEIDALIVSNVLRNITSPLLWLSALSLLTGLIIFRTTPLRRVVLIFVGLLAFMVIPVVNDIFETASVFDFVALRAQTTVYYTLTITGAVCVGMIVARYAERRFTALHYGLAFMLGVGSVASTVPAYGNPFGTLSAMASYPFLMPSDTAALSKKLEEMSQGHNLDAIVPEWVELRHRRHYVATVVRTYAPHVRSISAITRFGSSDSPDYPEWWMAAQSTYDAFIADPTEETYHVFSQILKRYPIDVVVMPHDGFEKFKAEDNFLSVDRVGDYRIYQRTR